MNQRSASAVPDDTVLIAENHLDRYVLLLLLVSIGDVFYLRRTDNFIVAVGAFLVPFVGYAVARVQPIARGAVPPSLNLVHVSQTALRVHARVVTVVATTPVLAFVLFRHLFPAFVGVLSMILANEVTRPRKFFAGTPTIEPNETIRGHMHGRLDPQTQAALATVLASLGRDIVSSVYLSVRLGRIRLASPVPAFDRLISFYLPRDARQHQNDLLAKISTEGGITEITVKVIYAPASSSWQVHGFVSPEDVWNELDSGPWPRPAIVGLAVLALIPVVGLLLLLP